MRKGYLGGIQGVFCHIGRVPKSTIRVSVYEGMSMGLYEGEKVPHTG
jgi:hypothetical protein